MNLQNKLICHTAMIAFLTLPGAAFADGKSFLGFGLGGGSIGIEIEAEGPDFRISDEDDEGAGAVIFMGGTDRQSNRGYAIFKVLPFEDAVVSMIGASYDWKFHEGPWRPYLGLTAGLAFLRWTEDLEVNDQLSFDLEGETARSFALGVQGGFLYEASESLNFDLSLRAVGTDLETAIELQQSGSTSARITQTVTGMSSLTLGANFLF